MIYLVEDDNNIRELVEYTLCSVGLETKGFETQDSLNDKTLELQNMLETNKKLFLD